MSEKTVWVLEKKGGPWADFLKAFLDDVPVQVAVFHDSASIPKIDFSKHVPVMVFADPSFLGLSLTQKMKAQKQADPRFRIYLVNSSRTDKVDPLFDAVFANDPVVDPDFIQKWSETLPMPENIRILVIDDEEEIGRMVRDYFGGRREPSFEVLHAPNGKEGLETVMQKKPDLVILDIKMPVMDGREFYAELKHRKINVPAIVFFDAISGEELVGIRKYGNPPVIEKNTAAASLPVLMQLAKKLVWSQG